MNTFIFHPEKTGERIDALLPIILPEITRNNAQHLIDAGLVLVNGVPVKKNYKCCEADTIQVTLPPAEEVDIIPQNIPLEIVFEDSDVIVVNKPRGLVVHPAPGHPDGTLVNALLWHCGSSLSGVGGEKRPGIVHRIDMDTSGLIIAAKNDYAHQQLAAQLADHSMFRIYEAVVFGKLKEHSGTINAPIARHPIDRKRMCIDMQNGRAAITNWEVINTYCNYTHIRCRLETGRTHQIRVHMEYIGHPIVGDLIYGKKRPEKGLSGQCLHAKEIEFTHPRTFERIHLTCPLPDYFETLLSKLGPKDT